MATPRDHATESKLNGTLPPDTTPPTGDSVFDNLDALRIVDPATLTGDVELLAHIPVRKPKKDEYFRVNPDPELQLTALVWTDHDEGETFLVTPSARDIMAESGRVVMLVLCQSRQGVHFIWPVHADTRQGGGRGWAQSARAAMVTARTSWVKMRGDRAAGGYQVFMAAEQSGDPTWPDLPFSELLKIGFRDRLIESADHPVVRRLQGYT